MEHMNPIPWRKHEDLDKYAVKHNVPVTIDGKVATVGSANMDVRSFVLNFEVNAFMYDNGISELLENEFENDLRYCVEITKEWYHRRKWWFKVKEAVARLVSPML